MIWTAIPIQAVLRCADLLPDAHMTRSRLLLWLTVAAGINAAANGIGAQHPEKPPRIGYLSLASPETFLVGAFRQRLRELGWTEGKNLVIDYRDADGQPLRLPELAAELVGRQVSVIVAAPTVAALAAQRATRTIPIVFTHVSDPIGTGLADSLAQPGRNVTGWAHLNAGLNPKRLALLKEAIPDLVEVGALWNPGGLDEHTEKMMLQDTEAAARDLRLRLRFHEARSLSDCAASFAALSRAGVRAMIVLPGPLFRAEHRRIVELAGKHRMPAFYFSREFADAGGLISYGVDLNEVVRGAASYVDKLLKGSKPGDLPVEQASKFELVINMKTARALGVAVPPALLARADEIIE